MAELLISDGEKVFIMHGMQQNVRIDGRGLLHYRPMELETDLVTHANGSARLRLATTDVLVAVKAEIDTPNPTSPKHGGIEFFVDCSANATPEFEGRGGEELATDLSQTLSRAYSSQCVFDTSKLSILPGIHCWILYVDILILECGGNLFDAVSLAVKAALYNTKIPNATVGILDAGKPELGVSDDPFDSFRLDAEPLPCFITLSRIGTHFLVDPTLEEEACSQGKLVLGFTKTGHLSCMRKSGPGAFKPETLQSMMKTGRSLCVQLNMKIMDRLKEEEQRVTDKGNTGFLR